MNAELLILADRAQMKTYKVETAEGRGPMPRLVERYDIAEGRSRLRDEYTDDIGAFPNGGTNGQGNSIAEKMTVSAEYEMRAFRKLAEHIDDIVKQQKPEHWAFAAPAEINGAIIDGLTADARAALTKSLPKDLVNVPADELLAHFQS